MHAGQNEPFLCRADHALGAGGETQRRGRRVVVGASGVGSGHLVTHQRRGRRQMPDARLKRLARRVGEDRVLEIARRPEDVIERRVVAHRRQREVAYAGGGGGLADPVAEHFYYLKSYHQ